MSIADKTFYHFNNGVKISDHVINMWLEELRRKFVGGANRSDISSGDTMVSFIRYESSVFFYVSNSSGYSKMTFYSDEYGALENYRFNYSRPECSRPQNNDISLDI